MEDTPKIVNKAEKFVSDLLLTLPETMVYHNLNHTWEVVKAADNIANYANLTDDEKEILMLAAWFHDTGFKFDYNNHEEKSIEIAKDFLAQNNYPEKKTEKVVSCITSTKIDREPKTLTECVLCDADFIHLSKNSYFDKLLLLKSELERTKGDKIIDSEWFEKNLKFLKSHQYYTQYGKTVLGPKVEKNKEKQSKMLKKLGRFRMK